MLVFKDDPAAVFLFLPEQLGEEVFAGLFVVFAGAFQLFFNLLGNEGVAVSLAVGMGHGDAYRFAPVLKEEDVFDLLVGAHIVEAVQPHMSQFVDVFVGQVF